MQLQCFLHFETSAFSKNKVHINKKKYKGIRCFSSKLVPPIGKNDLRTHLEARKNDKYSNSFEVKNVSNVF